MKLNVIREAEVDNITKSIQGKVNEVKKRTMSQPTDATSMTMPHNSISSDQDLTTVSSEIFKVCTLIVAGNCMISLYPIPLEA